MYEFKHEEKEKRVKLYLVIYSITSFINLIFDFTDLVTGRISIVRFIVYTFVYAFIFYFSLKRKQWAIWLVRLVIWLNILLLLIIIVTIFLHIK
jgi:hypothetical protein